MCKILFLLAIFNIMPVWMNIIYPVVDNRNENETYLLRHENDSLKENLKNESIEILEFKVDSKNENDSINFKHENDTSISTRESLNDEIIEFENVNGTYSKDSNKTEFIKNEETEDLEPAEDNIVFRPLFAYRQMQRKRQGIANRRRKYFYHPEYYYPNSFYSHFIKYPLFYKFPFIYEYPYI